MGAPLWTETDTAAATAGAATAPFTAQGVSIDSRDLAEGDLFIALKDARDGHDFIGAAFEAGAAAAIAERRPAGVPETAPLVIVDDVMRALDGLGRAARARTGAKVIGVTGSVGKTGTKEMLRACLAPSGATHAAEKSFNNHWGVPVTLSRMAKDAHFAVIEMGMNAPGEIGPLSRLARPDVAIITTIAPVHMAAFQGIEGIANEKAAIFEGLTEGGTAILPADSPHFERLKAAADAMGARVLSFGAAADADARLDHVRITSSATVVKATLQGEALVFKLGAPGRHLAMNALAALAGATAAGADLARASMALGTWAVPDGRGARWRVVIGAGGIDGEIGLIDESYNANPTSMQAAFEVLAASQPQDHVGRIERGRRVAFLGDMLELGPDEAALHAGLAEATEGLDTIHLAGPLMKRLHDALPKERRGEWYATSREMAAAAGRKLDAGDVAMVKGSFGSRMALVVDAIKRIGRATQEGT